MEVATTEPVEETWPIGDAAAAAAAAVEEATAVLMATDPAVLAVEETFRARAAVEEEPHEVEVCPKLEPPSQRTPGGTELP
jgi:hypothetical protein